MAKISEKLSGMNLKFDQERVFKLDQVENRLRNLDDRYSDLQETLQTRNNGLREHLQKLQRTVEEERAVRDTQLDNKVKELISIEQKYSYLIEQEIRVPSPNLPNNLPLTRPEKRQSINSRK
jgi:DNA repair ATPase RecN